MTGKWYVYMCEMIVNLDLLHGVRYACIDDFYLAFSLIFDLSSLKH